MHTIVAVIIYLAQFQFSMLQQQFYCLNLSKIACSMQSCLSLEIFYHCINCGVIQQILKKLQVSIGCSDNDCTITVIISDIQIGDVGQVVNDILVTYKKSFHQRTVSILITFIDQLAIFLGYVPDHRQVALINAKMEDVLAFMTQWSTNLCQSHNFMEIILKDGLFDIFIGRRGQPIDNFVWAETQLQNFPHTQSQNKNQYIQNILCFNQGMYYFIRHAQSTFNELRKKLRAKYGHQVYQQSQEFLQARFNMLYADAPITQLGKKQAQQCRNQIKDIHVQVVVVSPLRRTLQTCQILFKDHKSKPKIIVDPLLRGYIQSSCDIGLSLYEQKKPKFDYSRIKDPQAWYLHEIYNQEKKQSYLQRLEGYTDQKRAKKAAQLGLQFIKTEHQLFRARKLDAEKRMQHMVAQKAYIKQQYGKYQSVVILSHSENIKAYFGINVANCQILQIKAENL